MPDNASSIDNLGRRDVERLLPVGGCHEERIPGREEGKMPGASLLSSMEVRRISLDVPEPVEVPT